MVVNTRAGAAATITEFLPPKLESLSLTMRWNSDEDGFFHVLERMASEYVSVVPQLKTLQLNIQIPIAELEHECERLVRAYSTTTIDLRINPPPESDDEWGDWRTVSSDSDESSEDSDEVELYGDSDSDEG